MPNKRTTLIIHGKTLSPGMAEGGVFLYHDTSRFYDAPVLIEKKDVEQELGHLENSTATITGDLLALATRVEQEMDSNFAAVFEAHQQILNDPVLKKELRAEILEKLVSAGSAVKAVFMRWEKRFLLMESRMAQHRSADMRDISNRLSNALAGIKLHPLEEIPPGSVLIAGRLHPSDTIFLARRSTAAVVLKHGREGSHAALFMRAMGLPCVTNIKDILQKTQTNDWVLIDADAGEVVIRPGKKHKVLFENKQAKRRKTFAIAKERAKNPALTLDGTAIAVFANVVCRNDTAQAIDSGADGIGLYRTEQAYTGRMTPPGVDELFDEMRQTLDPAGEKPVYVRLLDAGADKPLPFIGFLGEMNPALGNRGIRMQIAYPHLMETQLRAILKLSDEFDVRILIPMVTLPDDIVIVKECLAQIGKEHGAATLPKIGAMIETPAAALSAKSIAPLVDFMSFGTNDLTQYTFAADRENAAVEQYFNDSDDVIFRLMSIVHNDAPLTPLSICGELAGRAAHISRLLQCGIRTFSVVPPLIPVIKETIRQIRLAIPAIPPFRGRV